MMVTDKTKFNLSINGINTSGVSVPPIYIGGAVVLVYGANRYKR
jgi:hypothetical protein